MWKICKVKMSIVKILEIIKNWRNLELVIPLPDSNSLLPTFGLISCEYKCKKLCTCHIWICVINSLFKMQSCMKHTRSSKLHAKSVFIYIFGIRHLFVFFIFRKSKLGMCYITYNLYKLMILNPKVRTCILKTEI